MTDRRNLDRLLNKLEEHLKQLQIRYEQYFGGIEKREPIKDRELIAKQLNQFVNRRIVQTDLRFRSQNLAARFHSYCGHWDRTLRLIEEGRYHRGVGRVTPAPAPVSQATDKPSSDIDKIYQDLVDAHTAAGSGGKLPGKQQVAAFLEKQQERIREKFGDREIQFQVTTEDGKPKIKVRAK